MEWMSALNLRAHLRYLIRKDLDAKGITIEK
jgi:hypothetical protein